MAFDIYRRTQIGDVTTYVRPYQTISYGPLNGNNSMIISEEQVMILPDSSTANFAISQLNAEITNPNDSFNIVDPTTGDVTGSMTFAQLKVQMYSLYLYLANIRDNS